MKRPHNRQSYMYKVYCSVLCKMKSGVGAKRAVKQTSEDFHCEEMVARTAYKRFIRANLEDGIKIEEMF